MVSFPPVSPPRPYTPPLLTHTCHKPSPSHSFTTNTLKYKHTASPTLLMLSTLFFHKGLCPPQDHFSSDVKGKSKVIPLQAWRVPEGSRRLRIPEFQESTYEGAKVVSTKHRPPLLPLNIPCAHFFYRLNQPQSHNISGGIVSMENFSDTTGDRTRDFLDCSEVPQPTPPPRGLTFRFSECNFHIFLNSLTLATFSAHPIQLDIFTLTIFGEESVL